MRKQIVFLFFFLTVFCFVLPLSGQKRFDFSEKYRESSYYSLDTAEFYKISDPKKAYSIVEHILIASLKGKDKTTETASYRLLGEINHNIGNYDIAIDYYQKAKDKLNGNTDEFQKLQILQAKSYAASGDYQNALLILNTNNSSFKSKSFETNPQKEIAEIYYELGDYDKSIDIYNKVLKSQMVIGDTTSVITTNNRLGEILLESNKDEQALEKFEQAIDQAQQTDDKKNFLATADNVKKVYRNQNRYNEELQLRQQTIELNTKLNNQKAINEDIIQIGDIYLEQNDANSAIDFYKQGIDYANKWGDIEKKSSALKKLSKAYDIKGDYTSAYQAYKDYAVSVDSFYSAQQADLIAELQLNTELLKKGKSLDLLEKDLKISEVKVELLNKDLRFQKFIIGFMGVLLLIMVVTSVLIYRNARQKRIANQLLALKSLRTRMNPHFIFNALNSVNTYISKSDEKSANKYLADFSKLMRMVMENSKYDLVPLSKELDIIELYLKLEHNRFDEKFSFDYHVDKNLDRDNIDIPPMLIQPFIENAIWHGLRYKEEKGFLKVNFINEDNYIRVVIEDDGIGRKKSQEIKTKNQKETVSTGLKNIEGRIKIINELHNAGILLNIGDLNPEEESGTRVEIKILKS